MNLLPKDCENIIYKYVHNLKMIDVVEELKYEYKKFECKFRIRIKSILKGIYIKSDISLFDIIWVKYYIYENHFTYKEYIK